MLYPALVTIFALMMYQVFTLNVGRARDTFGVKAPAITGSPEFEARYRVQMNTLEQIIVFIPSLWMFALFLGPVTIAGIHGSVWAPIIAAILGVVWILGRIIYARGYYKSPSKRHIGFMIAFISTSLLMLGALAGMVIKIVTVIHS
jgi:glutathione S-transferase